MGMRLESAVFNDEMQLFHSLRIMLLIVLLCHAAIQDVKHRVLKASAWVPIVMLGVFTLIFESITLSSLENVLPRLVLMLATLTILFLLGFYELGDAVVLVGIGLTHISTTRPVICGCLLQLPFPEFSVTVLLNAELLSLVTIVLNLVHNLNSGALPEIRNELFRNKLVHMLLLKAVKHAVKTGREEYVAEDSGKRMVFVKQSVPMVLFILLGYLATLLFGSLVPISLLADY